MALILALRSFQQSSRPEHPQDAESRDPGTRTVGVFLGPGSRYARPGRPATCETSPPLGLHVMHVDVLAAADVGDGAADVLAVLPDRLAVLDVDERHLVADRNVVAGAQAEVRI